MSAAAEPIVKAPTPGLWSVGERSKPSAMLPIRSDEGKHVGFAYREADARLIAEAPGLLFVANYAQKTLTSLDVARCTEQSPHGLDCGQCLGCNVDTTLLLLAEAIGKAEGQQP